MKTDFDKFVDALIKQVMKATGMTREELLEKWSADGKVAEPAPVIEVGDVVTVESTLAHPDAEYEVTRAKGNSVELRPIGCLHVTINALTHLRKGPKVIEITEPLINSEHFINVPKLLSGDMPYGNYHVTLTLTEETSK